MNVMQLCESLKLNGILHSYQSIADECSKTKASYTEYLQQVLLYELNAKHKRAQAMMLHLSGIPIVKTLEQFDFSGININQQEISQISSDNLLAFASNTETGNELVN